MSIYTPFDDDPRDRPRGILSQADRKFLLDRSDYSRQNARQRRMKIVERVENAVYDFWLLQMCLEEREIQDITEAISTDGPGHPISEAELDLLSGPSPVPGDNSIVAAPGGFHRGLVTMIALFYRIYGDDEAAFERLLQQGVGGGIDHERNGQWDVEVDLEIERIGTPESADVIDRLEAGLFRDLSDTERKVVIARLIEEDALDLNALRRSFAKDEEEFAKLAEQDGDEKFVKQDDGEFTKLDDDLDVKDE